MARGYDEKRYAVLYVDDEDKSLKYFKKAFEDEFNIMTAQNGPEAIRILEQKGDIIGVVISDQRMPGQTGVDLLTNVRRLRPNIIRILTTAYSDLESAIEAVNDGAIFKYIVKPWDIRELRGYLHSSMEFFLLQEERNHLLREKMSILQRIMVSDRIRSLAVLSMGLSHQIRNPMTALKAFLDLAPAKLLEELPDATTQLKDPEFWGEFWATAQHDGERILAIIDQVAEAIVEPCQDFDGNYSLTALLRESTEYVQKKFEEKNCPISVMALPDLPLLKANEDMLKRLLSILLSKVVEYTPSGKIVRLEVSDVISVWGTPGLKISMNGEGPDWSEEKISALFSTFSIVQGEADNVGLDLLPAFFICHHHGGDIRIYRNTPEGPGFEIYLPFDPEKTNRPPIEKDYMTKLMSQSELWEGLGGGY
jgi:two-component system probable response regulator PhcQ